MKRIEFNKPILFLAIFMVIWAPIFARCKHRRPTLIPKPGPVVEIPHPSATWPWTYATRTELRRGVTRWFDHSPVDGTTLELFEFDFAAEPGLRLGLYDQDEDDATPHDDKADYFPNGIGQVTRHLNEVGRGPVLVAWNGPFFAYDRRPGTGPNGLARHVGPVVQNGVVRHFVGNPRWTFGAKSVESRPTFDVVHQPDRATLRTFDVAAAGVQCLIRDRQPLRLAPYPQPGDPAPAQPVPSTEREAGHIPYVDHMRTSRTSLAWDNAKRRLYLVVVNEFDHEIGSKLAVKRGGFDDSGWSVADLQRFWLAFGAPNAVNSDGGAVMQMTYRRPDGKYEMIPPRLTSPNVRLTLDEDFKDAPEGGTLMTFFVSLGGAKPAPSPDRRR